MNSIQKLAEQYAVANRLASGPFVKSRRQFAVNGERLATPELTRELLNAVPFFAGMTFLESVHQEIEAAKPSFMKTDLSDEQFDNSPYRPTVRAPKSSVKSDSLDMGQLDADEIPMPDYQDPTASTPKRRGRPAGRKNKVKDVTVAVSLEREIGHVLNNS
jgi:hypothetical protein